MRLLLTCLALTTALAAQDLPKGTWDAQVAVDGNAIPFRMQFDGDATALRGALMDGDRPIWSTAGALKDGMLALRWDFFDSTLTATWQDGEWRGSYDRRTRAGVVSRPFSAHPYKAASAQLGSMPADIAGEWIIQAETTSRAKSMAAIFRQSGTELTGTIQRVDGDFGTLTGTITAGHAVLSHFDGIRATLIDITANEDGTLAGVMNGKVKFKAARADKATALGLAAPPDPARYTSVKDPSEPFAYRFQDLDGNWVANTDARFKGKVVLATLTGSWCPNCHDEAPMLASLYREFHDKGLEVIALGFEYSGEVDRDRAQLRAFARRHNLPYTIVLAGTTEDGEVVRKLPQIQNFGAFPTTFFLGRDGRVRAVHAGFAGPANVVEHARLLKETRELVEQLLAEK